MNASDLSAVTPLLAWGRSPLWCLELLKWSVCCLVNGGREGGRTVVGRRSRTSGRRWRGLGGESVIGHQPFSSLFPLLSPLSSAPSQSCLWAPPWNSCIFFSLPRLQESGDPRGGAWRGTSLADLSPSTGIISGGSSWKVSAAMTSSLRAASFQRMHAEVCGPSANRCKAPPSSQVKVNQKS